MKTLDAAFDTMVRNIISGIKGLFLVILGISVLMQAVQTFF